MEHEDKNQREPIPKEVRAEVFEKFGGHCAYCGIQLKRKGWHCDHVVPVASGGIDDICNLFPSCAQCNQFKSAMSLFDFKKMLENQTLNKCSFILAERFGQITPHPTLIEFWYEKQGHTFDYELVWALIRKQNENGVLMLEYSGDT